MVHERRKHDDSDLDALYATLAELTLERDKIEHEIQRKEKHAQTVRSDIDAIQEAIAEKKKEHAQTAVGKKKQKPKEKTFVIFGGKVYIYKDNNTLVWISGTVPSPVPSPRQHRISGNSKTLDFHGNPITVGDMVYLRTRGVYPTRLGTLSAIGASKLKIDLTSGEKTTRIHSNVEKVSELLTLSKHKERQLGSIC